MRQKSKRSEVNEAKRVATEGSVKSEEGVAKGEVRGAKGGGGQVEPRGKWEELKVEEEVEQRVKEEGLKGQGEQRSHQSNIKEVELTTIEGLWLTGRETEEWLDLLLGTEVWTKL